MTKATARKMSRAERAPLQALVDFTEVALKLPAKPFGFLMQCVAPHLSDKELTRLEEAAWLVMAHVEAEQTRREQKPKRRKAARQPHKHKWLFLTEGYEVCACDAIRRTEGKRGPIRVGSNVVPFRPRT